MDTTYGVMICGVMDPRNLTFPEVNISNKALRIRADKIYIDSSGKSQKGRRKAKKILFFRLYQVQQIPYHRSLCCCSNYFPNDWILCFNLFQPKASQKTASQEAKARDDAERIRTATIHGLSEKVSAVKDLLWLCLANAYNMYPYSVLIKPTRHIWCIGRESNPGRPRGRRAFYHWTTDA